MKNLIKNTIALIVGFYTMPVVKHQAKLKETTFTNETKNDYRNASSYTHKIVYSDSPEYLSKNDFTNYMLNTKGIICL